MGNRSFKLHDGKTGAAIAVRVTPRARTNTIQEILNDGTVRVHLKAAADDPGLNRMLVEFLAEVLGVPADQLEVVVGQSGHDKLISVYNLSARQVQERILKKLN